MKKARDSFWIKLINSKKKKVLIFVIVFLLVFLGYVIVVAFLSIPDINSINEDYVFLGAHRGNVVNYTENTLPAFKSALEEDKYFFIEFDVQYTQDKIPVIHHDLSLLRLQGKTNKIMDLTYDELLAISNYHIPTYNEVMDLVDGKKPLNIEIKSQGNLTDDKLLVDFILADLKNRGVLNSTLMSSISSDVLIYLDENYPGVKSGKIYWVSTSTFVRSDKFTQELYDELDKTGADFLMIHASNLRNYEELKKLLPGDKSLAIWYRSTDEIYLIQPTWFFGGELPSARPNFWNWLFRIKPKACLWWCDTN